MLGETSGRRLFDVIEADPTRRLAFLIAGHLLRMREARGRNRTSSDLPLSRSRRQVEIKLRPPTLTLANPLGTHPRLQLEPLNPFTTPPSPCLAITPRQPCERNSERYGEVWVPEDRVPSSYLTYNMC